GQRQHVAVGEIELEDPVAPLARATADGAVALRHLLGDKAGAALGTRLEDGLVPHHELAFGIAVAGVEELPAPRHALVHLALAALEAGGARRLGLVERADVLAVGVARAADELAEAAEADLHRLAAEVARLVDHLGDFRDDLAMRV